VRSAEEPRPPRPSWLSCCAELDEEALLLCVLVQARGISKKKSYLAEYRRSSSCSSGIDRSVWSVEFM
jgi:hypothetical protein